nr:MAG TPA: hypothetical protein [Caudoviricetes sp.]
MPYSNALKLFGKDANNQKANCRIPITNKAAVGIRQRRVCFSLFLRI